jgi:hypothetical protein
MNWLAMVIVLTLAGFTIGACAGVPRNDRDWDPYLAHTTHVELSSEGFSVSPVTDWSYDPSGATAHNLHDSVSYDFSELRSVWFVLEPQPGSKLAAHTFLMFEFSNDRLLGVTIEARRRNGQAYSALRGVFHTYELAYVWGSARDLMTRRAVMLDHQVYMYPITINAEQKHDLLANLLLRARDLETHPRWYNTLTSNCTNELAKATQLHWTPAYVLTGLSDNYLFAHHLIPGASFEDAFAKADVKDYVKALNLRVAAGDDGAFDAALLGEMRRRFALTSP